MTSFLPLAPAPLLLGTDPARVETLAAYLAGGGYPPVPGDLTARVEAAGLRGRGGAGFPLAAKFRALAARGATPVVVANGGEGEPGSVKDRALMRARPHLVLDGLRLAAAVVGADRGYLYTCDPVSARRARAALDEAPPALPGPRVAVVEAPPAYVAGEESAAVRFIDGGPALPVAKPPRVFERGVGGAPTLVANVETLAHLALLAAGRDATGHLLITVSGAGREPVLAEVPAGIRLGELAGAYGAGAVTGALLGGLVGGVRGPVAVDLPLDPAALAAAGSALGCGTVHLLGAGDCPVDVVAGAVAYLADESSRQCGVCVSGTRALATTMAAVRSGDAGRDDLAKLTRWAAGLPGRGACGLLDAAARTAGSLLTHFADLAAAHARTRGGCAACAPGAARGRPPGGRLSVVPPLPRTGRTRPSAHRPTARLISHTIREQRAHRQGAP
jgi:NADH:ubiquinone oxidoreductase subunit F (NADH-binding)